MSEREPRPTLELTADEMRALGHRAVDLAVDHLAGLREKPAGSWMGRRETEELLREELPETGEDPAALLGRVTEDIFRSMMHVQHPLFFGFVPSPSSFPGVLADLLSAAYNPFLGTWFGGSTPAQIELVTLDWLRQLCALPTEFGGLLVSGGSVANLTALAVARHERLEDQLVGAIAYYSDQTHSAVERALRLIGLRPDQLRKLPSDDHQRLSLKALKVAIQRDRGQGLRPFCVVANAGTTNTGAVDPLKPLAALCQREDLWLHADGAYGAPARLCERGRAELPDLELVDSLSLDPHKWLFQPLELGCVLLRRPELLEQTFSVHPEYLEDADTQDGKVNFCDRGIQLTRSFRALKLWLSFKIFGAESFRKAVEHGFELADRAQALLERDEEWELVTPSQLAMVCFRFRPKGTSGEDLDQLQRQIVEVLSREGKVILTSTTLRGQVILRLCTINPRATPGDLELALAEVRRVGRQQAAQLGKKSKKK